MLIGCGGLVALVVVVAVLAAVFSGGGTDTADSPVEEPGAKQPKAEQPKGAEQEGPSAGMGEPLNVGDVSWTVTNAQQATELTSPLGESKQGNFVIVDFDFTNNAGEAVTLDSASLALLDGEGRTSEVDTDNSMYVDPERDVFLQQVNPGVTRQGQVIFSVAPDASDFTLELGDTNMIEDNNGYVELGF